MNRSGGRSGDFLEVLDVPEKGSWLVGDSNMPGKIFPLTESERGYS